MGFTSYAVDNDGKFRAAIARAQLVANDLRVPFGLILQDFYKSEQAIFALKGPGQYPPFKNSVAVSSLGGRGNELGRRRATSTLNESPYQRWKKKKVGFDYPLLVRYGALSASLLSSSAPGSVASIGPTQMIFGTNIKYGIYHQSDEPRKKIPLRKFLFIGPEAPQFAFGDLTGRAQRWLNIMNDFVLSKTKEAL